jgi:O-antigen ligase
MKTLRSLEKIYVVLAMLFLTNGLIPRSVAENDQAGQLQPVLGDRIGIIVVYLILIPLLVVHWRKIIPAVQRSGWIIALCGLAVASAAWSYDVQLTFRRGILLSAMTMFAIYVGSCFDWDEQLDLFGWLSVIAVVGSALMAIFVPYYGISHDVHAGSLKGLFPHRSIMARQMVFAILTLWLGKPKGLPNWLRKSTLASACVLLVLSNAATSMIALVACIAMYPGLYLLKLPRRRTLPLWVPLTPLFGMAIYLVLANFNSLLALVGRSSTLTGRTAIWNATLMEISKRPWFGYGYDVFWNRYSPDLAGVIGVLQFRPPHAHDGYLDIVLALGRVGLFLFLGGFITCVWRAGRLFVANEIHGARWPLFVLIFFAIFNITESNILRPLTFLWVPYVVVYVSMACMWAEERQRVLSVATPEDGSPERAETSGTVNGILPGYGT